MSDVLQFEFGQPQEVAIKYTEPKVFDGQYGERCMYSLTDGRVMYVDPLVAARIKSLGVTPGEQFYITKRKQGRLTEWEVSAELPAPAKTGLGTFGGHKKTFKPLPDLVATVAARNGNGANLEEQLQASIDMVARRKLEAKLNAEQAALSPADEFTARLVREASAIVAAYAQVLESASQRYNGAVKSDDVRSIVLSAYINAAKRAALREVADGKEHVGVLWEDAYTIVEYPADEEFEKATI